MGLGMTNNTIYKINGKEHLTIQETANYLCRSDNIVRGYINSGLLPKIQTFKHCRIMIAAKDILRFVEETRRRVLD